MKLQTRFTLILVCLLLALMASLALLDYQRLRKTVYRQTLDKARDIRSLIMATRRVYHHQFLDSGLPLNEKTVGFLPAYSLSRIARDFQNWSESGMTFNTVSDRPRNPNNAADRVELEAMEFFRSHPEEKERMVLIESGPGGAFYHYSQPIWIEKYCLECHGPRAEAPPSIQARYETAYDYKEGDLRGLLSIKLPATQLSTTVWQHWRSDMILFAPALALAWLAIGWGFRQLFLKRFQALGSAAQQLADGDTTARAALRGNDELASLGKIFDRMALHVEERETELRKAGRLYQTLSRTNQLILRLENPEQLYTQACRIMADYGGFQLACVALVEEGKAASLSIVAAEGPAHRYLEELVGSDCAGLQDATETLASGRPRVCHDLLTASEGCGCSQMARRYDLRSSASIPLLLEDRILGTLLLYSDETDAFSPEMVSLLTEIAHDIAFAHRNFEREQRLRLFHARVEYLTHFDPLTGLPNREHLASQLEQSLARSARHGHWGGLLHIDLDHFKRVNDSYGNSAGDTLLIQVGQFLEQNTRDEDSVARIGSDEFLILLEELADRQLAATDRAMEIAEKLREGIDRVYRIGEKEIHLRASIGIALFPLGEAGAEEVLQQAGAAVHQAKAEGRNCARFFSAELQTTALERLALERELHRALEQRQFTLFYQPQTDDRGRLVGAEALIRWNHPEKGLVLPGWFIPLLEESGLIRQTGRWVIEAASRQAKTWQEAGLWPEGFHISINVSAAQLDHAECLETLERIVNEAELEPDSLELEITESALLNDELETASKIRHIQRLGFNLSIDDFGTGYSSLARLARLPVSTIKIDRTFIQEMLEDPRSAALVESILDIAHRFRLDIIAEGVETREQLAFLSDRSCPYYQGYLFGKPMPADMFERDWLGPESRKQRDEGSA